jgi:hypothetical protein
VLPAGAITQDLRILGPSDGFPDLPPTELAIYKSNRPPTRTTEFLYRYLADHVGNSVTVKR